MTQPMATISSMWGESSVRPILTVWGRRFSNDTAHHFANWRRVFSDDLVRPISSVSGEPPVMTQWDPVLLCENKTQWWPNDTYFIDVRRILSYYPVRPITFMWGVFLSDNPVRPRLLRSVLWPISSAEETNLCSFRKILIDDLLILIYSVNVNADMTIYKYQQQWRVYIYRLMYTNASRIHWLKSWARGI